MFRANKMLSQQDAKQTDEKYFVLIKLTEVSCCEAAA